jgi:hypothetical protein
MSGLAPFVIANCDASISSLIWSLFIDGRTD